MKQRNYGREIAEAIKQCPTEAQALAAAKAELARLEGEKQKAEQALQAIRSKGREYVTEKRIIGGVEIEIQRRVDDDESGLLSRHLDKLDHQIRQQSHEIERANRRLSRATAAKLETAQNELQRRTEEALQVVTAVCADAESLEDGFRALGLDHEVVYAARYPQLQDLRIDKPWTRGGAIVCSLKEATKGVAA